MFCKSRKFAKAFPKEWKGIWDPTQGVSFEVQIKLKENLKGKISKFNTENFRNQFLSAKKRVDRSKEVNEFFQQQVSRGNEFISNDRFDFKDIKEDENEDYHRLRCYLLLSRFKRLE